MHLIIKVGTVKIGGNDQSQTFATNHKQSFNQNKLQTKFQSQAKYQSIITKDKNYMTILLLQLLNKYCKDLHLQKKNLLVEVKFLIPPMCKYCSVEHKVSSCIADIEN